MFEYFPRELYLEILKRLPLDSILQFRSVCKSWNSIITSNDFISAHQNLIRSINVNETPTLLIRYFDRTHKTEHYIIGKDDETFGLQFYNLEFPYASTTAYFRIVGCCNGLICLSDDLFDSLDMLIIWNPSIRKSIRVLVPNHEQMWPHGSILGFGVCPVTNDPKVVRIVYVKTQNPPLVEVFSLSSGAWRKPLGDTDNHNHNRPHEMIQITWSQICFNGIIHWIACDKRIDGAYRCLILSFDLVNELVGEMLIPDVLAHQHFSNVSINTRKGYLTVLEYVMEKEMESCGVWIMKEYGVMDSWTKLYIVHLTGVLRKTVGFRTNGDMVVALRNHELVCVDCNGNIRSLDIYANLRSFFLGSYNKSLILINQQDGQMHGVDDGGDNVCIHGGSRR